MANIRHPEWRDSHDPTKYPFSQTATLQSDTGNVVLEGAFLDAALYPVGGGAELYLSRVVVQPETVTLYIGDPNNATLASGTFDTAAPPAELCLFDVYGRPAGLLVSSSERLALFAAWAVGEHSFISTDTPFVARCCMPVPDVGFRGFELASGEIVTDDIWLVGENGVVLTHEQATAPDDCSGAGTTSEVIRIDIVGDPLFKRKLCADDGAFETPRFLRQLRCCMPAQSPPVVESTPAAVEVDVLFVIESTTVGARTLTSELKTAIGAVIDDVIAAQPDADIEWAVVNYKDVEDGGYYAAYGYDIDTEFTPSGVTAQNAIAAITGSGGGDYAQQQLDTLVAVAGDWISYLSGRLMSTRMLVWIGASPGWAGAAKGRTYATLGEASDALSGVDIRVIAVNFREASNGIDWNTQSSTIALNTGGSIQHDAWLRTPTEIRSFIAGALIAGIESPTSGQAIPQLDQMEYVVSPNASGNINISVGSRRAADTVLRVRPAADGMIIETVGEPLGDD